MAAARSPPARPCRLRWHAGRASRPPGRECPVVLLEEEDPHDVLRCYVSRGPQLPLQALPGGRGVQAREAAPGRGPEQENFAPDFVPLVIRTARSRHGDGHPRSAPPCPAGCGASRSRDASSILRAAATGWGCTTSAARGGAAVRGSWVIPPSLGVGPTVRRPHPRCVPSWPCHIRARTGPLRREPWAGRQAWRADRQTPPLPVAAGLSLCLRIL